MSHIFLAHFATLRDENSNKISVSDMLVFIVLPILLAAASPFIGIRMTKDFFNLSITFFGIFIALLLNIQVAIFGIFTRKWPLIDDNIVSSIQKDELEIRKILLKELNANVSYLIAISTVALVVYVILFVTDADGKLTTSISAAFYLHFLLKLLMVVKRTYTLFQKEYEVDEA